MKHVDPESLSRNDLVDLVLHLQGKLDARTESVDARSANLQRLFALTTNEASILELLSDGMVRSKEQIMSALYWDRIAEDDTPEIKIVDVWVCKIRKKIAGSGVVIETVWGTGYRVGTADILGKVAAGDEPQWDAEAIEARTGRPRGGPSRPKGEVRDMVLSLLRERVGADGQVRIGSRELVAKTAISSASCCLRNLENRGHISIVGGFGRHQRGADWVLELQ